MLLRNAVAGAALSFQVGAGQDGPDLLKSGYAAVAHSEVLILMEDSWIRIQSVAVMERGLAPLLG